MTDPSPPGAVPTPVEPRRLVVLIHGVGPFDEKRETGAVTDLLNRFDFRTTTDVVAFNWRSRVPGVLPRSWLRHSTLAAIGAAFLEASSSRLFTAKGRSWGLERMALVIFLLGSSLLPAFLLIAALGGAGLERYGRMERGWKEEEARSEQGKAHLSLILKQMTHKDGVPLPPDPPPLKPIPLKTPELVQRFGTACLVLLSIYGLSAAYVLLRQLLRRDMPLSARLPGVALPLVWPWLHAATDLPLLCARLARSRWKAFGLLGILGFFVIPGAGELAAGLLDRLHARASRAAFGWIVFGSIILLLSAVALVAAYTARFLGLLVALILRGPVGWSLTVVSDVIRYVGDPPYRDGVHGWLTTLLQGHLRQDHGEIVLVAHSLGSVIAADHLRLFPQDIPAGAQVTLITMGSPLRRLFFRFFPDRHLSPERLALELSRLFSRFRWINVYRPLDPIGTRLFGRSSLQDCCTNDLRRALPWILPAHTGYWQDPKVLDTILQALSGNPGREGKNLASTFRAPVPEISKDPVLPLSLRKQGARWVTASILLLPLLLSQSLPLPFFTGDGAGIRFRLALAAVGLAFGLRRFVYPYFASVLGVQSPGKIDPRRARKTPRRG